MAFTIVVKYLYATNIYFIPDDDNNEDVAMILITKLTIILLSWFIEIIEMK